MAEATNWIPTDGEKKWVDGLSEAELRAECHAMLRVIDRLTDLVMRPVQVEVKATAHLTETTSEATAAPVVELDKEQQDGE